MTCSWTVRRCVCVSGVPQEDQLGVADKSTARTFYAAGNFYDVMEQFPNKDPDIEVSLRASHPPPVVWGGRA